MESLIIHLLLQYEDVLNKSADSVLESNKLASLKCVTSIFNWNFKIVREVEREERREVVRKKGENHLSS